MFIETHPRPLFSPIGAIQKAQPERPRQKHVAPLGLNRRIGTRSYTHVALTGLGKNPRHPRHPRKSVIQTKEKSDTHCAMTGIWGAGVLISISLVP